jgi:uncharacterized membrane protein HdeD (DUF308 family)
MSRVEEVMVSNMSTYAPSGEAANAENRIWFIALGVILVVLGLAAIGWPLVTAVAAKGFIGWLLLFAGIAEIVHAFSTPNWKGFLADLLIGVLYAVVGAWLAFFPLTGIIGLTVLLALTFIVEGIFKLVMGFQVRHFSGWFWFTLSGLLAIAVGVLIFSELPSSAAWAIGLLVGVNLLMSGIAFLGTSLAARSTS